MSRIYFPGANTGRGFVSRFSGVNPDKKRGYTYVLKGGPGVGKSTLMKKVAERAKNSGMTVEEFRCASDPDSLDAIFIEETSVAFVDGTAPHNIDPTLPGITGETVNLGRFKNKQELCKCKGELDLLVKENEECYKRAYALLFAAREIKGEAIAEAMNAIGREKIYTFLSPFLKEARAGEHRELFARCLTPKGIVDHSDSFSSGRRVNLSGILGEVALCLALERLRGREATVGYDYLDPSMPRVIRLEGVTLSVGDGETLIGLCDRALGRQIPFLIEESERLSSLAREHLSGALEAHDKIEKIYRGFVDYGRVDEESERIFKELGI